MPIILDMSAAALTAMSPEFAAVAAAMIQQQTQQGQAAVVQAVSAEAGSGSAPIVSSSVTAPGSLEIFA
jgi:hypothetical protein